MVARVVDFMSDFLRLSWLTGPIFEKELRVSSRRRRNYVLRAVYLLVMTLFVALVWLNVVDAYGSGSSYAISRMSAAGISIITSITWFQFLALQFVAVIMLSTAISDEIYNNTLAVLVSTPITAFKIVIGKLFSKLLQLVLLLALSLPLLALVRVFGGVPWLYIVGTTCITLTACLFAGSVSMFFSVHSRRAYSVILRTLGTGAVLFLLIPFLLIAGSGMSTGEGLATLILHTNPFAAMSYASVTMASPAGMGIGPAFSWIVHCVIVLIMSMVVLAMAIKRVRRVSLAQAAGGQSKRILPGQRETPWAGRPNVARRRRSAATQIVTGPPVWWRERRSPLLGYTSTARIVAYAFCGLALVVVYAVLAEGLDDDNVQGVFGTVFAIIGLVATTVISATGITSEKEARSWPVLLATPLTDGDILWGKGLGSIRRCLPCWIPLFGHFLLFTAFAVVHPVGLVLLIMLVTWVVFFLTGTGLYLGVMFRRTTSAVMANMALGLGLWLIAPMFLGLMTSSYMREDNPTATLLCLNPVVQAQVVTDGATVGGRRFSHTDFDWPDEDRSVGGTFSLMLLSSAVMMLTGLLFIVGAKRNLRKRIL